MELIVASKNLIADMVPALDIEGREHLVIVIKASWRIPSSGQRPQPIAPLPLEPSDLYLGEPGVSAMLYGSDLVRFKPRCDVLFNAHAYSPTGEPVTEMLVGWRIGKLKKGLRAIGPRVWQKRLAWLSLSDPEPFMKLPLHFSLAYGGTRSWQEGSGDNKETLSEALPTNPSGIGWAGKHTKDQLDGAPAPCLEGIGEPIKKPDGTYKPVAFSAIGRHWAPRKDYAGTYDAQWQSEIAPLLPHDFNELFHQCAPEDQQMDYPQGGEPVVLKHMMAGRPDVRFPLPRLNHMKVRVLRTDYSAEEPAVVADTLYFEPDEERFSVIWRSSVPIRRRMQEFDTVAVGPVSAQWWNAKKSGVDPECSGCGSDTQPAGVES
ncbi:MAG: DUF2169 domain-containing protein [Pseudomonadota bacterium]